MDETFTRNDVFLGDFFLRGKADIFQRLKVLEKCTKNLIGHSRLAFNNHESNIDC